MSAPVCASERCDRKTRSTTGRCPWHVVAPSVQAGKTLPVVAPALLASEPRPVPDEVEDLLYEVELVLDEIEILDHSDDGRRYVLLEELARGSVAANNCHAASVAINEHLLLIEEGHTLVEVTYRAADGAEVVHYANGVTTDDGQRWVVDYTARQFDERERFPLVLPFDEWATRIDAHHSGFELETRIFDR